MLCYQCPFSEHQKQHLFCTRYRCVTRAWEKYGLSRRGRTSAATLARDGRSCRICGSTERLHVHYIDWDFTCDDPLNLISV